MPNDITDAAARSAKARKTLDRMRARAVKADEARTDAAHHARRPRSWPPRPRPRPPTAPRPRPGTPWRPRPPTKPTSAAAGPSWPTAPGTGGRARSQRPLADEGWSVGAHGGLALAIACGVQHGACMANASHRIPQACGRDARPSPFTRRRHGAASGRDGRHTQGEA